MTKQIPNKRESMKSRTEEVSEFKVIVEQERFREKQKILGKQKQMQDQLNCSNFTNPDTQHDA